MNKKKLATAMAAAMTLGAVAPVVANAGEITSLSLPEKSEDGKIIVNARLASGYKKAVEVTRLALYNTNNTTDRKDDTLKGEYSEAKILATKEDSNNPYADTFAVAKKETDVALVNDEIANNKTAESLIADAKKAGATVETKEIAATFDGKAFVEGRREVKVTPKTGEAVTYVFDGVDGIKEDTTVTLASLKKIFADLDLNQTITTDALTIDLDPEVTATNTQAVINKNYSDVNLLKYTIEKNISQFDVLKDEVGDKNQNLQVTLLKKGTKEEVIKITYNNFGKEDKNLIINMPSKTDVDGTWSEKQVKEAMLKGYVDATATFAPNRDITRAEFAKILCTVFDIKTDDKSIEGFVEPFADVKESDWSYRYITALYNTPNAVGKIISGHGDKETFAPGVKITREEAAKMVAAAYDVLDATGGLNVAIQKDESNTFETSIKADKDGIVDVVTKVNGVNTHRDIKTKFADDAEIATWADESAESLNAEKILTGKPGNKMEPKSQITREEALVMIMRAGK